MSSVEDAVRRRSGRGLHRDPVEVLAAVHEQVRASPGDRRSGRRLVGAAAALFVVGLIGLLGINTAPDAEAPAATEPELPTTSTPAPSDAPADPLPSLVGYLPADPVAAVEILRLEDGYSLYAAWESDLCISTRHGHAGGSACALPEYLDDTLLGFTAHLGDRPGYFISGAVGPEIAHVRATIADSGDRTIPVVGHSAFEDIQFFLLYIAPGERLEDLRAITRDRTEHPVMDVDRLARMADRIGEMLGE